jgi:hypothetical protein
VSPAAGGLPELVLLEADAEEAGADEAGVEEDCVVAAAGASWAWAAGIAATIAAATAAATKLAVSSLPLASPAAKEGPPAKGVPPITASPRDDFRPIRVRARSPAAAGWARGPPNATEVKESGRLPIDLFVRLTFHLP